MPPFSIKESHLPSHMSFAIAAPEEPFTANIVLRLAHNLHNPAQSCTIWQSAFVPGTPRNSNNLRMLRGNWLCFAIQPVRCPQERRQAHARDFSVLTFSALSSASRRLCVQTQRQTRQHVTGARHKNVQPEHLPSFISRGDRTCGVNSRPFTAQFRAQSANPAQVARPTTSPERRLTETIYAHLQKIGFVPQTNHPQPYE